MALISKQLNCEVNRSWSHSIQNPGRVADTRTGITNRKKSIIE